MSCGIRECFFAVPAGQWRSGCTYQASVAVDDQGLTLLMHDVSWQYIRSLTSVSELYIGHDLVFSNWYQVAPRVLNVALFQVKSVRGNRGSIHGRTDGGQPVSS